MSVDNEPTSAPLEFTPEEIELLQELSKLTDEQILSIFPTITTETIQMIRTFSQTLSPEQTVIASPNQHPQSNYTIEQANRDAYMEDRRLEREMNNNKTLRLQQEQIINNWSRYCPSMGPC